MTIHVTVFDSRKQAKISGGSRDEFRRRQIPMTAIELIKAPSNGVLCQIGQQSQ
ncbi:MAG TPA: hypothetical protein VN517_01800 [Terriglobales bacterium]|nr:hypothetical protein [Terriglobales bacterium]